MASSFGVEVKLFIRNYSPRQSGCEMQTPSTF